jgi:hypothetical protein
MQLPAVHEPSGNIRGLQRGAFGARMGSGMATVRYGDKAALSSHARTISRMIRMIRHPNRAMDHVSPPT